MERASRVRIVIKQERNTLFHSVTENRIPLARAACTYSLFNSSRTAARTCLTYRDDMATDSVRAGSATLFRSVPPAITGKMGKRMENRYMNSNATKKFGRLFPTKLHTRIRRSLHRFFLTAARIPSGTEISTVSTMETTVSNRVAGSLEIKLATHLLPKHN